MKTTHIDTIIADVIEPYEGVVDPDYLHRELLLQIDRTIPKQFHPVRTVQAPLQNRTYRMPEDNLRIIAVNDLSMSVVDMLFLYENEYFYNANQNITTVPKYEIDDGLMKNSTRLNKYAFTEGAMNDLVTVYTDQSTVLIFYHSLYANKNGEMVVPDFSVQYLKSYGKLKCEEIDLNMVLRGKKPGSAVQTRQTMMDLKRIVTGEYLNMQRDINLMLEEIILKPVEHGV